MHFQILNSRSSQNLTPQLKREAWQGQSQLFSALFQATIQPKWEQTAETVCITPSSSRYAATFSPSTATNFASPIAISESEVELSPLSRSPTQCIPTLIVCLIAFGVARGVRRVTSYSETESRFTISLTEQRFIFVVAFSIILYQYLTTVHPGIRSFNNSTSDRWVKTCLSLFFFLLFWMLLWKLESNFCHDFRVDFLEFSDPIINIVSMV